MWASRWVVSIRIRPCLRIRPWRIGKPLFSSMMSLRVSLEVAYTNFDKCGRKESSAGCTMAWGRDAVTMKSVSVVLILLSDLV